MAGGRAVCSGTARPASRLESAMAAALRLRNGLRHTESPMSATLHCGVREVGGVRHAESPMSAYLLCGVREVGGVPAARSAESARSPSVHWWNPQGPRSPRDPLPHRPVETALAENGLRQSNGQTSQQRPPSLVICQSEPMSPHGRACCHPRASATQPCQLPVKANVSAGKPRCQGKCRKSDLPVSAPSVYKHCGWPGQNGLGLAVSLQPDKCAPCIVHAEHLVGHLINNSCK